MKQPKVHEIRQKIIEAFPDAVRVTLTVIAEEIEVEVLYKVEDKYSIRTISGDWLKLEGEIYEFDNS